MNAHGILTATSSPVMDSLAISLRAFVTNLGAKPRGSTDWKPPPPSKWTLVLDTETTTDPSQRLRFGCYQLRKGEVLDEAGLFFDADALSEAERRTLKSFAVAHRAQMYDAYSVRRGRLLPARL